MFGFQMGPGIEPIPSVSQLLLLFIYICQTNAFCQIICDK